MDEEELLLEDGDWEEVPAPNTTATAKRGFDDLYEEGVDALLKKRFDIAFRAFSAAEQLKPGDPSVHANLERLRQMGWAS